MGRVYQLVFPIPNSSHCLPDRAEDAPAEGIKWFSTSNPHSRNCNTRQNFSCYGASPIPDIVNIFLKTPFSYRFALSLALIGLSDQGLRELPRRGTRENSQASGSG